MADYTTADGFSIHSTDETPEQIAAVFAPDTPIEPTEKPTTPLDTPAAEAVEPEKPVDAAKPDESVERNADGTFKAKGKPRHDPQARIEQAIAAQREAERKALDLEKRLAALETKPAIEQKPPTQAEWQRYKQLAAAEGLIVEKFEQYDDYQTALGLFIADKRYEEREATKLAKDKQEREAATERERAKTWEGRLTDARKRIPNYDARVNPDLQLPWVAIHRIADSPVGPDILLYLSEHPDSAQRLATLPPHEIFEALGEIKASLAAAPPKPASAVETKPVSQASAPIKPVGSSPSLPDPLELSDDLSIEEYIRRANALEAKKRGG